LTSKVYTAYFTEIGGILIHFSPHRGDKRGGEGKGLIFLPRRGVI
jgi:hypothetical protein